jgi:hypothetical protein
MRTECPECASVLGAVFGSSGSYFECASCGWNSLPPVSPDILDIDPDPDKDTPMTTIPVPVTDFGRTLTVGDITYRAHTADDVAKLIRKANASPVARSYVQKAKGGEGTGTLGLYVEAVLHAGDGTPFTHMKFFVVGSNVYAYSRTTGDTRANWRRREAASLHAALNLVQSAINKPTVKLFGHPVLVELTAADLSQIEEGGIPEARFRGQYRIEKDFGRYDFKMDISSSPLPSSLLHALSSNDFVVARLTASPGTPPE